MSHLMKILNTNIHLVNFIFKNFIFYHPCYAHIRHVIYHLITLDQHSAWGTENKIAKYTRFVLPATVKVVPWTETFRCLILCPACRKQFFGYLRQFHRLNTGAGDQPKVILQCGSQFLDGNIVFSGNTVLANDVLISQSPAAPFIPGINFATAAVAIYICQPMKLFGIGILAVHITHPI